MKAATAADPVNWTIIPQNPKMYKDPTYQKDKAAISKDKASSSIMFSPSCFRSYIDGDDCAQSMQILICYYCWETRKQSKKDQVDQQPTVLHNFVLPSPCEIPWLWKRGQMDASTCTSIQLQMDPWKKFLFYFIVLGLPD